MTRIWKTVVRWLFVIVVVVVSSAVVFIASMASRLVDRPAISAVLSLQTNRPPSLLIPPVQSFIFFLLICVWVLPPAACVGFALHARRWRGLLWGYSLAVGLFAAYAFARSPFASKTLTWMIALGALAVFVCALVLAKRWHPSLQFHLLVNTVALIALFAPSLWALVVAPARPPRAHAIWSVVLNPGTWQAMNTGSEYAATRQVVFAGDRIIAVFDAGMAGYEGKEPMSNYRLVSLDQATGQVRNTLEFKGGWGSMPYLYPTDRSHLVMVNGLVRLLNPDLTSGGGDYKPERGSVIEISPDGTTLALQTSPGLTLLDAKTFMPLTVLEESAPASISSQAALSNNRSWPAQYPADRAFMTYTDRDGERLIYHGRCGYGTFLSDTHILLNGCGKLRILDTEGRLIRESKGAESWGMFAGVSQNGRRFALQSSQGEGDPSELIYEEFTIYDAETASPVATVDVSDLPERESWSAFSPDGRLFVVGNPNRLTLYRVP